MKIIKRKVIVERYEVALFREGFPSSGLQNRSYWFEFDDEGNLVDSDVPEQDDGDGATTLSHHAQRFLEEHGT